MKATETEEAPRSVIVRTFYRIRVIILLGVLAGVILWGFQRYLVRRQRNEWMRPLNVALIVVREGAVDLAAIDALKRRIGALESILANEFRRYRPQSRFSPFRFTVLGPVDFSRRAPDAPGDGILDLPRHAYELWRWRTAVDDAGNLEDGSYDARIYLVVHPPASAKLRFAEGVSEQGGRIGTADVDLDANMVDFALFVSAHEMLHTVGALDKYDVFGRTLVPEGLAEPDKRPLYPQTYAEVMSGNVALSPNRDRLPESLRELRIGPATAHEIEWMPPEP